MFVVVVDNNDRVSTLTFGKYKNERWKYVIPIIVKFINFFDDAGVVVFIIRIN